MIIGIDGNEANIKNRVGVNVYAYQILWNLYILQDKLKSDNRYTIFLKEKPLSDLPKANKYWSYKVLPSRRLWVFTCLMPYLLSKKAKRLDVFFTLGHYLPLVSRVPMVCSIMDLGYLKSSEQFKKHTFWQLKYWSAISIYISKYVIAISNATKRDIVRHYPRASNKVKVTQLGYDKKQFNTKVSSNDVRRIRHRYSIVDDYIVFLSTLKPSKNIEGLLDAFKQIKTNFPDIKLVIAGKKGWLFKSIFEKVNKLDLIDDVIFTDFVADADKPALLAGAKVFASPSYWEGFGLVALEAMACGTPVVVSNKASFPEIVGKAGIQVTTKADSIAKGLTQVLKMDKKEYNMLVKKSVDQANKFSWEKCTKQTLAVFEKASKAKYK